ncbi:hypothetical protein J4Q44_G00047740 [Coregonus suidteri]|uniref:Uncharacterized protein n=1 Tax=Coregonus suidteri TaxID=861788 RepID=A0AAN8RFD1_9TELE
MAFLDKARTRYDLYHKVGGEVLLKPDKSTVPGSIISILWKHGKNKVGRVGQGFWSGHLCCLQRPHNPGPDYWRAENQWIDENRQWSLFCGVQRQTA